MPAHQPSQSGEGTFASIATHFELRYGVMRREDFSAFWTRIQQQIVTATQWLPADFDVAQRAGDITATLEREDDQNIKKEYIAGFYTRFFAITRGVGLLVHSAPVYLVHHQVRGHSSRRDDSTNHRPGWLWPDRRDAVSEIHQGS